MSAAIASSAAPSLVRVTNWCTPQVTTIAPSPAASCGWPSWMPNSLTLPLTQEFSIERKSGFHRNWAAPRSRIISPKVVKIWLSIGASMMRRITSL